MPISTAKIACTLVGSNGSATADVKTSRNWNGRVVGVYIDYQSQPATTTVTVKTAGSNAPSLGILTLPAGNTSQWYRPLIAQNKTDGTAALYAASFPVLSEIAVDDYLEVIPALGNAGAFNVWVLLETDFAQ